MYVDIYIEDAFLGNQVLTYAVGNHDVSKGMRVFVTVRNRQRIGFVMRVHDEKPVGFDALELEGVMDMEPVLDDELIDLASWLSYTTISPMIRCLQTILPNKLKPKSSTKEAKLERILIRTDMPRNHLTPRQDEFMDLFKTDDVMRVKDATKHYSGFRKLIDEGYFILTDREVRYDEKAIEQVLPSYDLTTTQQDVIASVDLNTHHTYLLHGATGSGKTEIYLNLAQSVLENHKQVLILVPEISLTPQMIHRVSTRFGQDVAIYHSALNDQEKYEQYQRVKNGAVNIVVGTRSAVFMPFHNLGLIVMDEEHDTSYKQDNTPFYHTRDVVLHRSETHQCPVILGSASPALETYARALRGVYTLLELNDRINHTFPKVTVIDTRQALLNRESAYVTKPLLDGIYARLAKKEQVVLLLNRRGYMTILKDKNNEVMQCPNCDIALSYHKFDDTLRCHMCGYQVERKNLDTKFIGSGVGTQRLQEHLQQLFPQSRIARMDADTTSKKNAHETILTAFENHEYDILIGTQMIAKGLDIERVTLVGIVNADAALGYTDYRSVEHTFAMLLQASGRAGRGKYAGEVMIQTANPDHYAIQCAIHQKYKHFFQQEMQYRKLAQYPPYSYLISFVFSDDSIEKAMKAANDFMHIMDGYAFQCIGPVELRKLATRYRTRIILKGKDLDAMIQSSHAAIEAYRLINRTGVSVDVNPLTLE